MNFMKFTFLSLAKVLDIHQDQIACYGGKTGTRDLNLLKSALGTASITYAGKYVHIDIYEIAAAYLFHLVENHPFIDGNKRTGVVVASVFLTLNGHDFNPPNNDLVETVLLIVQGELNKAETAIFIRRWTTKHTDQK